MSSDRKTKEDKGRQWNKKEISRSEINRMRGTQWRDPRPGEGDAIAEGSTANANREATSG